MPLNDLQIKRAKPTNKKQTLSDGAGLALIINPISRAGTQYFVDNYRFNDKQQSLRIGKYPDIGLAEAREKHQQARNDLAKGINPSQAKQQAKQERKAALLNTFQAIAHQWHSANLHRWKPHHAARISKYMENDVFPYIGKEQLNNISVADVKAVLARVITRNAIATAEKIRQWISAVYAYAAILELTDRNPAAVLISTMPKEQTRHLPALPPTELIPFYTQLITANIEQKNKLAMLLIMLLFPRSTEFRGGKWEEINWQAKTWTIPTHRMKHEKSKPKPPLVIPLSDWAIELLQELHQLTGNTDFLFPSRTAQSGVISESTLNNIIAKLGFGGITTPHGFRSLASSILNEQGFNPDAIERQLAHVEENKIRAAYNRAEYLAERTEFMQWYSDYLRERYRSAHALIQAEP